MEKFRPLHDRVLVKRVEAEEKTPAGIIIPDTAKEKPVEGEILAVGPGARDEGGKVQPFDVKVGDREIGRALVDELQRALAPAGRPRGGEKGKDAVRRQIRREPYDERGQRRRR